MLFLFVKILEIIIRSKDGMLMLDFALSVRAKFASSIEAIRISINPSEYLEEDGEVIKSFLQTEASPKGN